MGLLIIGAVVVGVILLGALAWWVLCRRRIVRPPAAGSPGTYGASPPSSGFGDPAGRPYTHTPPGGQAPVDLEPDELDPLTESLGEHLSKARLLRRLRDDQEDYLVAHRREATFDMMESGFGGASAAPARPSAAATGWSRPTSGGPPPGAWVPFGVREEPLPHNGLFIRRNNAFGTKSTLGITDLIDQGVMIDQTQVRFDDFVVSKADQVPRLRPERRSG